MAAPERSADSGILLPPGGPSIQAPKLSFAATTRERIILHFSREPHARHILRGPVANGYRGLQLAAQVRGADTGVHADQARRDACTRNCSPAGTDIVAMRPPDFGGRISCAF